MPSGISSPNTRSQSINSHSYSVIAVLLTDSVTCTAIRRTHTSSSMRRVRHSGRSCTIVLAPVSRTSPAQRHTRWRPPIRTSQHATCSITFSRDRRPYGTSRRSSFQSRMEVRTTHTPHITSPQFDLCVSHRLASSVSPLLCPLVPAKYKYNIFDVTKVVSQKDYPLIPFGKLVLNRNPQNYFAEVEQSAFAPAHLIPGIEPSLDRMLQARLFSYTDTHRHRLGVNYLHIPVRVTNNTRSATDRPTHRPYRQT